jgi:hypothetical protein
MLGCFLRCCVASQCGFVAQAPQPQAYTSFQPFFVPQSSGGQCFGQQPFFVRPVPTPAVASAQSNAFANAGVAQSFADACSQAFGELLRAIGAVTKCCSCKTHMCCQFLC